MILGVTAIGVRSSDRKVLIAFRVLALAMLDPKRHIGKRLDLQRSGKVCRPKLHDWPVLGNVKQDAQKANAARRKYTVLTSPA